MYRMQLTLWERLQLDLCIPRNAPLNEIRQLLRITDVLALSSEDKDAIGYTFSMVRSPAGPINIPEWNQEKLAELDDERDAQAIDLESEDMKKLRQLAERREYWPTETRSIELKEKLKAAEEIS